MSAIDYRTYLESDAWQRQRRSALLFARNRCQVCNKSGRLDVHHRTYERLGDERPADLIVLCRDCHRLFHKARRLPRPPSPLAKLPRLPRTPEQERIAKLDLEIQDLQHLIEATPDMEKKRELILQKAELVRSMRRPGGHEA